jgi:hypothetical protein
MRTVTMKTRSLGRGVLSFPQSASAAQLALAWVLSRGEDIVPLIGMSRRSSVSENLAALDIEFSSDEIGALNEAFTPGASLASDHRRPFGISHRNNVTMTFAVHTDPISILRHPSALKDPEPASVLSQLLVSIGGSNTNGGRDAHGSLDLAQEIHPQTTAP